MRVDAKAVQRLAETLNAPPFSEILGSEARLGLAVSGGPDSLALLLLAHQALPGRIEAASVDHQLRPESANEAAMVAELCARLDVPHRILTVEVEKGGDGTQANARAARYDALSPWATEHGLAAIATAHHADDQAETLLMRANRGAGLGGLAGIRPVTHWRGGIALIRPLLDWRRAELEAVVAGAGLEGADDPSNRDTAYDRSRMRELLAREPELDPARLARTASVLQDADQALDWALEGLVADKIEEDGDALVIQATDLPSYFQRTLIEHAILQFAPDGAALRGEEVDNILAALRSDGKATLRGLLFSGGERWRVVPAPPQRR